MTKIEKYFVIVCEEDYPISLCDWDSLTNAKRVQCVEDARNPDVDFIYNQEWIVQDGDFSLYESLNELVGRECKIMSKVLIIEEIITRESLDAMWADLRRRIQESDEPIKVTGIIRKLNQVEDERLRKESIQESEALGDA